MEPTARSSPTLPACGIDGVSAPGMPVGSLKPKRSAAATSFGAPSRAPSGANTELHDSANASASVPPQASPPAFERSTPSSTAWVWTGNAVDGLTIPAWSAADVVMTLKVDPGGCSALNATPASASTWPLRGCSAATPP